MIAHAAIAAFVGALGLSFGTVAQQSPPPPACTEDIHRAFDFWIGEWAVFGPGGNKVGENSITREEGGCLLVERWTSETGSTGQSYNYVDLATGEWRQVWVSSGFTIDYSGGLNSEGEMVLEGTIAYRNRALGDRPFRGTWTPQSDGTVTQSFHQYDEASAAWQPWFTGVYRPLADAE